MFVIEDEWHAEIIGRYDTLGAAMRELRRLATVPWHDDPNRAPCRGWRTCGRSYEIVACDASAWPWREIARTPMLEVGEAGTVWSASAAQPAVAP